MPAKKKDPSTRARRNKASTAATLRLTKAEPEPAGDYASWTVPLLKNEIDSRNADRPDEEKLSKRGNKASLIATLSADDAAPAAAPELPPRPDGWHEQTRRWWADVWASPMSNEWHDSDIHNVFVCAMLYDDMWCGETAAARQKAAAEFRQQRASLGLTPYDRRRLEWTIESADEARARGEQRRGANSSGRRTPQAPPSDTVDPRALMHLVNS